MLVTLLVLLLILCLVICAIQWFVPLEPRMKQLLIFIVIVVAAIYVLVRVAPGHWP